MSSSLKSPQLWLGIIVSIVCLLAIFVFVDPNEMLEALRRADYAQLVLGLLFITAYLVLRAVRWRYMLGNQSTTVRVFHLQNIGYMLNQILPFRLGDAARAVLVGNEKGITVGQGLSTMVVERVLDMLAIIALLPLTLHTVEVLPEWMQQGVRLTGFAGVLAVVVVVLAANFRPKVQTIATNLTNETWAGRLDDLLAGLNAFTNWRTGLTLAFLSIVLWLPMIVAYRSVIASVGLEPSLAQAAFVMCAAALSIAAPSSPGQVGVFHAGVTAAIVALGMSEASGAAFAFMYHTFNFLLTVGLGIIGLWRTQSTFGEVLQKAKLNRS